VIYLDACYIARLYVEDHGFDAVRALAATDDIVCSIHGMVEIYATFHRKYREGAIDSPRLRALMAQFDSDCDDRGFQWHPLSLAVIDRVHATFLTLPSSAALRAGDAIHLACAAEVGVPAIYSNDKRLLASAEFFGIRGIDVIRVI
jgi:predicted nucleic acid-binding protein